MAPPHEEDTAAGAAEAPRARRPRRPAASPRATDEWQRRIAAEYGSAALTQHLTLWLTQIGASPDLILAGLDIAADEIAHAQLSHAVATAALASRRLSGPPPVPLDREGLGLLAPDGEPLEHAVLHTCVGSFCLGETVAVPLFKEMRAGCTVQVARRALDRILRDEVRHRDFGWALLGWLLGTAHGPSLRAQTERELPELFRGLRAAYGNHPDVTEMSPADRAWGLMPGALYAAALERTFERDYRPRFARLGIDAAPAWEQSRQTPDATGDA